MNDDDFLNRLRKAPPPEFLTGLKARLDRQPRMPPERRSGFGRGLIVGFLVAGVSFAATSVSLTGLPTSPGRFFTAPVEFLTRVVTGRNDSERDASSVQIKAVPLGSWLPTHINTQPASAAGVDRMPADAMSSAPQSTAGADARAVSPGPAAAYSTAIPVVAQRDLYPFAVASLSGRSVRLRAKDSKDVFDGMCAGAATSPDPNIIETTRRITADQRCSRENHRREIVELQVGYQAIVLARSKLYGPLNLSARDLYLALAKRVPNPEQPDQLIDNPYTTWNQVDPALPYDNIHVYGPARNSPEGKLAGALLLNAGCNTFPALVALRDRDPAMLETTCQQLRTDKAYEEISLNGFNYPDALNIAPTALAVTTLAIFPYLQDRLIANPIDGVVADTATLAAQSYPASRLIYLYASKFDIESSFGVVNALMAMLSPPPATDPRTGASLWGFVEAAGAERPTTRKAFEALETVQFGY